MSKMLKNMWMPRWREKRKNQRISWLSFLHYLRRRSSSRYRCTADYVGVLRMKLNAPWSMIVLCYYLCKATQTILEYNKRQRDPWIPSYTTIPLSVVWSSHHKLSLYDLHVSLQFEFCVIWRKRYKIVEPRRRERRFINLPISTRHHSNSRQARFD